MSNLSEVLQATKGPITQLQREKDNLEEENRRLKIKVDELINSVPMPIPEMSALLINNDPAEGVGLRDSDSSSASSSNALLKMK